MRGFSEVCRGVQKYGHGQAWVHMAIYWAWLIMDGDVRECMGMYGCIRVCTGVYGCVCVCTFVHRCVLCMYGYVGMLVVCLGT